MSNKNMPLWEVFIRARNGLPHKHVGSIHAISPEHALQSARDVFTRRGEGVSIWVVPSMQITASDPQDKESLYQPTSDKIYRHPTFYTIPSEIGNM